jgi:TolB-like protein/DNA-binding winged helix-turn-helix (wHTH) protein/Flp pilus assembly protein TadD
VGHFQLGPWLIRPSLNSVVRNGTTTRLTPKAMAVLVCLAEHPGEPVAKEKLLERVWPETFVSDDVLKGSVAEIRRVLEDNAREPRIIETVAKRGYRLIAPLEWINGQQQTPAARLKPRASVVEASPSRRSWMLATTVAVLLVLIALGAIFDVGELRTHLQASAAPQIRSLAVLPLQNLSPDPEQEYFSDGMTDALITSLAQIGSLKVISRTSSMQYKQSHKSLPEIARELNVDGIVEGTVQRSGYHVRITAQLIDARHDQHLWAESYESDLRDVVALQDKVSSAIAKEIRINVRPEKSSPLPSAPVINREAYELYLKGRYFWNKRNAEGFKKALDYFQQAVERDPGYAPAYAGLADTYSLLGAAGYDLMSRAEAMEKARSAAQKALLIDGALAEAHASLAYVTYSYDWNWVGAGKEFERAIALDPNYPTAHQWYSEYLDDLGRGEEALVEAQTALTLDPLSINANHQLARAQYFVRRWDQAIDTTQKTLEMDPNFAIAHLRLGRAYAAKGLYPEAIKQFHEFSNLSGDVPMATASIGNALARSGDRPGAIRALNGLRLFSKHNHVPSICFALVHAGLGDNDQAIAWLEQAYKERSDFLLVLNVDPLFDPLRRDPRFQELLRRVGFPG